MPQEFQPIKLGEEAAERNALTFDPNSVEGQVELFFGNKLSYPLQAQIAHGVPEDTGLIKDAVAKSDHLGTPAREFYVWIMDEPGAEPSGREGDILCWVRVYEDNRVFIGVHSEEAIDLSKTLYEKFGEQHVHKVEHPKHNSLPKIAAISGISIGLLAGISIVSGWLKGPQVSLSLSPAIPEHTLQSSQTMEFLRRFENSLGNIQKDINAGITDFRTQPTNLRSSDLLYFHQVLEENDTQALKAAIPLLQRLAVMAYKTDGTVITSNTNVPSDLYTDLVTRAPQLLEKIKERSSDEAVDTAAKKAIIEINKAREEALAR